MSNETLHHFRLLHNSSEAITLSKDNSRVGVLPIFKIGEYTMEDDRKFKMSEADLMNLKQAFLDKKNPCPVLYEHAKGPRGGVAGGKVVSLQNKNGSILAHASLTKKAYAEIADEEWFGTSAGFLAVVEDDGTIRPRELLEVSLTNIPAFPALGEPQIFTIQEIKDEKMEKKPEEIIEKKEVLADQTTPEAPSPAPDPLAVITDQLGMIAVAITGLSDRLEDVEESLAGISAAACGEDAQPEPDEAPDMPDMPMSQAREAQPEAVTLETTPEAPVAPEPAPVAPEPAPVAPEATPEAVEEFKDYSTEQRKKMADSGDAMPDGSFPIANGKDLENAIKSYGRASDPAAAKSHIRKRAKVLGLTDKLPEGFEAVEPEKVEAEIKVEPTKEELEVKQTETIKLEAEKMYAEKIRKEKIQTLLERAKTEGKFIPAVAEHIQNIASSNPEAFEAMLPYIKQSIPTNSVVDKAPLKVELQNVVTGPEKEAVVYNIALAIQKQFPSLSLPEAVGLVKQHQPMA